MRFIVYFALVISWIDRTIIKMFQCLCDWLTRKTGLGNMNVKLAIVMYFSCLMIETVSRILTIDTAINWFILLSGAIFFEPFGFDKDDSFGSVLNWFDGMIRFEANLMFIAVLLVNSDIMDNSYFLASHTRMQMFSMTVEVICFYVAIYCWYCKGLPPCKGELWEKIKDILTAKQPAVNQNGG